ncbi:putative nuclease HARBI1 [Acropora millepora]|uniref:putative nuclease HARBI1 n=1 Tax=Acropora millepora TaxID=45264 RepID=UPI001CF1C7AB|nr:putative nuclease HARBI1 [Acropora millepora]
MNSRAMALILAQKKEKERKLVGKRKRDARRRFQAYVRRRRVATQMFVLLITRNFFPLLPVRKIWTKPRTTTFWEETCQRWNDQDWKENFRMSQVAFEYLTMELSPIISKRDTNFRKAISARQRLVVTLYRLADTATYRTIANLFAIGKSTVCEIVVQVCNAIVQFLLPRYIRPPQSAQEIRERIDESRDRAGFPQVVACVDGCHIPFKAPQNNPEDYVNRKGFHSIILQGLVDANYLFLDVCVGWPGKVHDARLFKNSSLYTSLCGGVFTLDDSVYDTINGVRVPPIILGDSAYPLQDWLMKPYVDRGNLSVEELQFNNILSVTRVVVENGYGRLKGRFPALAKRLDLNLNNCCTVIAACCVLHNFCEIMKEEFDEQWLLDIPINGTICPSEDVNQPQDRNARAIREAIKSFLS